MLETWGQGFDEKGVETETRSPGMYYISRERSDNNTHVLELLESTNRRAIRKIVPIAIDAD